MELSEIKQYSHKIIKITVTNENNGSQYKYATIKVHLDKETDETIRFSTTESPTETEWLPHQSFDDDYFLRIPNITPSITTIYAHFFPSELYDYIENEQIFSIYDFEDFFKSDVTNQWDNNRYPLQIESYGYDMVLGTDNKPLIRSLLNNSVTNYKDPNYKNYIAEGNNATEKGYFPLSSRYRSSSFKNAPNLNDINPYWSEDIEQYSDGAEKELENNIKYDDETSDFLMNYRIKYEDENVTNEYSGNDCIKRKKRIPYWEAKIHRSGLSPLISETTSDNDEPINVYLNYEYLPTSTEYHQHYFGFEEENIISNKQTTKLNTYEVFDSEGLTNINQSFGEEDKTYRIINNGNPYDSDYSFYLEHKNIYDLNLDKVKIVDNCLWEKNSCQKYWTYTPTGKGSAYLNVTLKAHTGYVLKYFMYIPADAYIEDDSCYVEVQSNVNGTIETIGKLSEVFRQKDKDLRHEWVYHEIPFYTNETNNRIVIKGPQHNYEDIVNINRINNQIIDNPSKQDNIEIHDCRNDRIHFYSMQIAELSEYSPTLKYTQTGLYVTEQNQYTYKPISQDDIDCSENINATNEWIKENDNIPTPFTDVYIYFDDDFDIIYNKSTSELLYTGGNPYFEFAKYDENTSERLEWLSNDQHIELQYDRITSPESTAVISQYRTNRDNDILSNLFLGELKLFNAQRKVFTTGINNEFFIRLRDAYGQPITEGEVECAICLSDKDDKTPCSETEKCLGTYTPDENGIIKYERINFKNFTTNKQYYLRVKYKHRCYNKEIIKWKPLNFIEERFNMETYIDSTLYSASTYTNDHYQRISRIYENQSIDELPLKLQVQITDQLGNIKQEGYCELSINEKVIQSTFVDENGIADFYLNSDDLDKNDQTIKIEYYIKQNENINYSYFVIRCPPDYDNRPIIDIKVNKLLTSDIEVIQNHNDYIININKNDILFINVDTENNKDFTVIIKHNDEEEVKQITTLMKSDFIIPIKFNESYQDEYIIATDNIENEAKYRRIEKKFIINWTEN